MLSEDQFVKYNKGHLPMIITSPHGGSRTSFDLDGETITPPFRPKKRPANYPGPYSIEPDTGANFLANSIAQQVERLTGFPPYQVKALFHRKIADANRPLEWAIPAIEDAEVLWNATAYRVYHNNIQKAIEEIRQRFPKQPVWLIDVHAHAKEGEEKTIIVGTKGGETLNTITLDQLKKLIFKPLDEQLGIWLPNLNINHPVSRAYSGGYTVQYYSKQYTELNGIQLEFGPFLRQRDAAKKFTTLQLTGAAVGTVLIVLLEKSKKITRQITL